MDDYEMDRESDLVPDYDPAEDTWQPANRPGWKKGKSGNPNGRPMRARARTLYEAAEKTHPVTGQSIGETVADMLWGAVSEDELLFPSGRRMELSTAQWIDLFRWINSHLDGGPR